MDSLEILKQFGLNDVSSVESYGTGHINDTFRVVAGNGDYILQRLNTSVFKNPETVMSNINSVTSFLRQKIVLRGGNPSRESITLFNTSSGNLFFIDDQNSCWRLMNFISNTVSYETAEGEGMLEKCGLAFGKFIGDLTDFPVSEISEVIPKFHDTPERVNQLLTAINVDKAGRANSVKNEIMFALNRESDAAELVDLQKSGKLPLRVTHNDAKMANILLDKDSGEVLCAIDLDTVMPGLTAYDFGDSIRSGAVAAAEDEDDLNKVNFSIGRYRAFAKGFLKAAGKLLTEGELYSLPVGAKLMTYECGIRFLADYLNGDIYYKTAYPEHNLVRARNQFKLVKDMEDNMELMHAVVSEIMEGLK